jgi:hypothetical protein
MLPAWAVVGRVECRRERLVVNFIPSVPFKRASLHLRQALLRDVSEVNTEPFLFAVWGTGRGVPAVLGGGIGSVPLGCSPVSIKWVRFIQTFRKMNLGWH